MDETLGQESEMDVIKRMLLFVVTKYDELSKDLNADISKTEERLENIIEEKISSLESRMEESNNTQYQRIKVAIKDCRSSIHCQTYQLNAKTAELRSENRKITEQWQQHYERLHQQGMARNDDSTSHPSVPTHFDDLKKDLESKINEVREETEKSILYLKDQMVSQHQPRLRSFSEECRNAPATDDDEEFIPERNMNRTSNEREESSSLNVKINEINKTLHALESRIQDTDTRVLECEQYSRRECVVISGIPANIKEEKKLESTVIEILKNLEIYISGADISAIHRLGETKDSKYPARVIVKFVNRKVTNWCFERKDWLPDLRDTLKMNVRFYESLAQLNQESLRLCYWLKENNLIYDHFMRNGYSKIVIAENGKPIKVSHPQFLRDKFSVPEDEK